MVALIKCKKKKKKTVFLLWLLQSHLPEIALLYIYSCVVFFLHSGKIASRRKHDIHIAYK